MGKVTESQLAYWVTMEEVIIIFSFLHGVTKLMNPNKSRQQLGNL